MRITETPCTVTVANGSVRVDCGGTSLTMDAAMTDRVLRRLAFRGVAAEAQRMHVALDHAA